MAGRIIRAEKTCTGCGEVKPIDQFMQTWNNQRERYYHVAKCDPCRQSNKRDDWHRQADAHSVARRARYANDPAYRRKMLSAQHKSKFGITLDEKDALFAAQGFKCAACSATETTGHGWQTDHDHGCCPGPECCGRCIRGVLCHPCNLSLGQAKESVERLRGLIDYIQRSPRPLMDRAI